MLMQRRQHPYHSYFDLNTTDLSSPRAYLEPATSTSSYSSGADLPPASSADPSMPTAFAYAGANPAIRIQNSTPTPQQQPFADSLASYNTTTQPIGQSWGSPVYRSRASHRRAPSASSSATSAPSPYNHARISDLKPDQSPSTASYLSADATSRAFSNNLPTPTATPTSEHFNLAVSQSDLNGAMVAHYAMKDMLMAAQDIAPDTPDFTHSGRHSVSSGYDYEAPTTPHTMSGDEHDFKNPHDILKPDLPIPKLDRTVSDAMQDELYNPMPQPLSIPSHPAPSSHPSLLSPYRSTIHKALQAADQQRRAESQTQSPRSPNIVLSRDPSPFRHGSPYALQNAAFAGRYANAAQMREQQRKVEAEAAALESRMAQHQHQHQHQQQPEQPKSISPKDTIKEYHESEDDASMPLFPPQGASHDYEARYGGGNIPLHTGATPVSYPHSSDQSYATLATSGSTNWAMPQQHSPSAYSSTPISTPSNPYSSFVTAPIQLPSAMNRNHHLYQAPGAYGHISSLPSHEDTPEFPAQLTSMESSVSEVPISSQNSMSHHDMHGSQKPASSQADTGTYTCTYHGCTLRFATPQKLQKHKREAHRSVGAHPTTTGVGSGMTSAQLMARNSQAGPHRCDRINPTTGKSCNTIFSRPYDLTRHEDTIHNSRKQKVRCALCVEEKTFSRNDALTRHMRVVHPEVDFPGKHRRRGATGE